MGILQLKFRKMKKFFKMGLAAVMLFQLGMQNLSAKVNRNTWIAYSRSFSGRISWDWYVDQDLDRISGETSVEYNSPYAACLFMDYRSKPSYSGAPHINKCVWGTQRLATNFDYRNIKGTYSQHRHSKMGTWRELITSPTRKWN